MDWKEAQERAILKSILSLILEWFWNLVLLFLRSVPISSVLFQLGIEACPLFL